MDRFVVEAEYKWAASVKQVYRSWCDDNQKTPYLDEGSR